MPNKIRNRHIDAFTNGEATSVKNKPTSERETVLCRMWLWANKTLHPNSKQHHIMIWIAANLRMRLILYNSICQKKKGRADVPPNSSGFHRGERKQFPDLSNQVSDLAVSHRVVLTL